MRSTTAVQVQRARAKFHVRQANSAQGLDGGRDDGGDDARRTSDLTVWRAPGRLDNRMRIGHSRSYSGVRVPLQPPHGYPLKTLSDSRDRRGESIHAPVSIAPILAPQFGFEDLARGRRG